MNCPRCKAELPAESKFCNYCGKKLVREKNKRIRGNGDGTAYQLPNGKWRAVVVDGYSLDENGKKKRIERTKSGFKTKKEALAYLPKLKEKPTKELKQYTLKSLYDMWFPTHNRSKSTMGCYSAAIKHFSPYGRFL